MSVCAHDAITECVGMCVLNVAASAAIMDGRTKAVLNTSALLKPVLEQFTTLEQATQGHTETHHTHSHTLHTYAVHTHTHTHTHTALEQAIQGHT